MNIKNMRKLNNQVEIPVLGLGVFKSQEKTYSAVRHALDIGYRHIDTAMIYGNEKEVGQAIKDSGIDREHIFVTTKLWTDDMRKRATRKALETSLRLLDMEYVDLYLIHWAVKGEYVRAYGDMEKLYGEQKIRAIGVSNFLPHHIEDLFAATDIVPAVNQIEIHPYFQNKKSVEFCNSYGIAVEAHSPLARGRTITDNIITKIAKKYGVGAAQVVIRWHLQKGNIVIPKSVNEKRIADNANVFDFSLTDNEISTIDTLESGQRIGSDPDNFAF